MNKKFSTLLAAFLVAGFSYTVEAGVVKVTNPTSGRSYVIAADGLKDVASNDVLQLLRSTNDIKSNNASSPAKAVVTDDAKWIFSGNLSTFTLKNVGKVEFMEDYSSTARFATSGYNYSYVDDQIIPNEETDKSLLLTTNDAATFVAKAPANKVYFYAVTEKVADVALTHLKFNGKWLIAKSATEVELVDDATLEAYKTANPTAAQWKVTGGNGYYESVSQTSKYLKVAAGVFALDASTNNATVFEENAVEGLFGATAATGEFEQLIQTNTGAIQLKETPATTDVKLTLERAEVTPSAEAAASITVGGITYGLAESISNEYYLLTSKSAVGAYYISQKNDNTVPQTVAVATAPDKYAYWKVSGNNVNGYTFKNQAGVTLKVDGVSSFKSENAYNNGFIVYGLGSDGTTKNYLDLVVGGTLTFVNRENPTVTYSVARMFALGNNKYAVEYNYGTSFSKYGAGRDTLSITPVDIDMNARQMDGYRDYSDEEILDTEYRLAVASTSDVNYYVTENHAGRHLLGLSKDVENATNWKLVRMDRARQMDKDGYFKYATDSVYIVNHPQYYKNGKYYASNDTVAIVAYALQNTANGEYMTYEYPQKEDILSMVCWPNSENYVKHSTEKVASEGVLNSVFRFVIKEKADGKVNLLGVVGSEEGNANYFVNLNNKLYGATTEGNGAVQVEGAYTQINSNDLFDIQKVEAPEYVKKSQGDVIRIFREENDHDVMYEKGEFLNLGNIAQLTDMAPGLQVDTAYVNRGHNNRYQYLLVVNPKYVPAEPCDIPGHPTIHPDTTYGRFLVNMIDSAVYTNKYGEIHANKFINDKEADETYVKLGFVWGYRTGDKLYLTEGQKFNKVKSAIDLNSRDFNIAKFAFRYVNAAANDENGAFKIQTRYVDYNSAINVKDQKDRRENNNGYLKTINGVVVVTEGVARGEEFNLAAESSAPTANDGISTSEVSVIAGSGIVTIKGAEGKTVVIANVLGQTIANTVLSSDNATISAPAGVVVVAIEGEAAVKAIVK